MTLLGLDHGEGLRCGGAVSSIAEAWFCITFSAGDTEGHHNRDHERPGAVKEDPLAEHVEVGFATLLGGYDTCAAFVVDAAPGRLAIGGVGFLLPRLPGPDSSKPFNGEINPVATDPRFRRRGYGRAAVGALMDWMVLRECYRISLTSSSEGEPLYASPGVRGQQPTDELAGRVMAWYGREWSTLLDEHPACDDASLRPVKEDASMG